ADRIIVPSEYLKGIVVAWGVPAAKVEVIYNAMPIEAVGRIPQAVAQLPRPLIVTAGRLVPWKGIDGVIDAVAMVPGASLAVIGEGPERSRLERRAREMLPGRAVFTGALAHPEVLAAIQSASAFVLNSSYEGLSHLLIEALMVGAPIVATRVGGNPEVIRAHEDGMLVPHDDAAALRAALAEALARGRRTTPPVSVRRFSEASMLDATAASLKAL
ncbi:MAG TPA: glycosyltransferase, partial [Candidatus Paceibacterota bacterium]|nr:glycosyltransferase [Candidatus Paceibacterota bacterium]